MMRDAKIAYGAIVTNARIIKQPSTATATSRTRPQQDRSQQTYDLLLKVAGELLSEVGIARISTNMICMRAGVTPPALYRYFKDKYSVLEALGRRLMSRQNDALEQWIARYEPGGASSMRANIADLLRMTAEVTATEPGAVWILRALHASPKLVHIRLESHRYVTDRLTDAYLRQGVRLPREELWWRLRLSVEMGFAVDQALQEEDGISPANAFAYAAELLQPGGVSE